jgi:hypothetical protein
VRVTPKQTGESSTNSMNKSQQEKARRTAAELMRISAQHTGTVEELFLVEAAKVLMDQTVQLEKLQDEYDRLHIEYARHTHIR